MNQYNGATICLNGHVLSKYDSNTQNFCERCGKETISTCPSCHASIRGLVELSIAFIGNRPYNAPAFCYSCSSPFPWTKQLIDNAVELIALDSNLDVSTKEIIKNSLPDIVVETPTTPVAIAKYKTYMKSASLFVRDGMYNLLVDVVSDTVKKSLFE